MNTESMLRTEPRSLPVVVQKYGGSSLADLDAIRAVARRVVEDRRRFGPLVVVVSAMGGTTDELLARARDLCDDPSPRELAVLLSTGEQITMALLVLTIQGLGEEAVSLTGGQCGILTEDSPLNADILEVDARRLEDELAQGRIVVVAGYQGVDSRGRTTTLGRGGSDTTAVALAAALGAARCEIYTDVEGVFSADPHVVPTARRLTAIDLEGMEELAHQGSGVLKAEAVELARRNGVELQVAATGNGHAGTTVHRAHDTSRARVFRPDRTSSLGVSARTDLLQIRFSRDELGPARLRELHEELRPLDVVFFNESTGGAPSRVYVSAADLPGIEAFRRDLSRRFGDAVEISGPLGAATLVGLERESRKGALPRALELLADRGLQVVELYTSRRSITLVVAQADLHRAVRELHRHFVETDPSGSEEAAGSPSPAPLTRGPAPSHRDESPRTGPWELPHPPAVDLLLLGCGNIGRRVARLVAERSDDLLPRVGFRMRIAALCDRSGFLVREDGDHEELLELVRRKEAGEPISSLPGAVRGGSALEMIRAARRRPLERPILVDVSDADEAEAAFREAVASGCHVVTANKKPIAGDATSYRRLLEECRAAGRRLKGEATVGAGLPILDTLEMLSLAGDRIRRIEGCLSGTLSSLMSWVEEGSSLSEAVRRAVESGYTEPDPAADLTGTDVARKAVILSRLAGLSPETTPVHLTGLVDSSFAGLALPDLFERLRRKVDGAMARQVETCRRNGQVLRYVARITSGAIEVGPVPVPRDSRLGTVRGPDNVVVFHSERYADRPLTVSGPGAGVDVTAMAVLFDILRIGGESRPA